MDGVKSISRLLGCKGLINISLLRETKGVFCFLCNKRSPEDAKENGELFTHVISQKRGANQQKKNTGWCFPFQLEITCKNSVIFEGKNTQNLGRKIATNTGANTTKFFTLATKS